MYVYIYNSFRKYKHMEAKQYAPKQPMNQGENQRRNKQTKISGDKWEWKYSDPKSQRHSKSSSKKEFYSKIGKISNKQHKLTLIRPRKSRTNKQTNPKLVEGKKS